jgi:DNA polymerase III sliding clamp (beta) subunit (PCNA family)
LESAVSLRLTDALIEARTPTTTLVSKLIDATYVAYDRVFPDPGAAHFTCDRKALSEIVSRLGALNPQGNLTPVIGFRWADGDESVCVTLPRSPDTAEDYLAATDVVGSGACNFKVDYMEAVARTLPSERLHIDIGSGAVARVTAPGQDFLIALGQINT